MGRVKPLVCACCGEVIPRSRSLGGKVHIPAAVSGTKAQTVPLHTACIGTYLFALTAAKYQSQRPTEEH